MVTFADVLGIWPFTIDEFVQAFHDYVSLLNAHGNKKLELYLVSQSSSCNIFFYVAQDSRLLGEIHVALLTSIIKDIEDVARTPSFGLGTNQNSAANPGGGHPQIVEGVTSALYLVYC